MKSINAKLKKLRKDQKLTQGDLADAFQVTKTTISKAENNKIPSDKLLQSYSSYFNISLEELISLKKKSKAQNKLNNLIKNADQIIQAIDDGDDININLASLEEPTISKIPPITFKDYDLLKIPYFEKMEDYMSNQKNSNSNQSMIDFIVKKGDYSAKYNLSAIRINDERMSRVIPYGAIAIIDKGVIAKNGDIVAYNTENHCSLGRYNEYPTYVRIRPESYDHLFQDVTIAKDDINTDKFTILGKIIHVISDNRTLNYD